MATPTGDDGPEALEHMSGDKRWAETTEWVRSSLAAKPVGFVLNLGPRAHHTDGETPAPNIQCVRLEKGVYLVRRAFNPLPNPLLVTFAIDGVPLDHWFFDDHFEDGTDSYLFTRNRRAVAAVIEHWFRYENSVDSPAALGCDYRFPQRLLPVDWDRDEDYRFQAIARPPIEGTEFGRIIFEGYGFGSTS
ncbi:hypothetical protein [Nocardia thailandica]|uniref:hypothetical protein n=1 Tax=Nocardia thailandica TaxID=257275 RepID=UPI0012F99709|nr:hypothetical protein [Nocardia thailandica]